MIIDVRWLKEIVEYLFPHDCYFFNILRQENVSGWPQVEFGNSNLHSVKHMETAEYNMGLYTGTYLLLLTEYTAVTYGY